MKIYKLVRASKTEYIVVVAIKTYQSIYDKDPIVFKRLVAKPFWKDFAGGLRIL